MKRFFKFHFPAIVYALIVFLLSSVPGMKLPKLSILNADKLLHFLEYSLFAILIFRSFSDMFRRQKLRLVIIASFFFLFLFAVSDELYQRYIPGRNSDIADVLLDILGSSLILFLLWLRRHRNDQKSR